MRMSLSFWCYPDSEQELAVTDAIRTAVAMATSARVSWEPCSPSGDRQPGGWEESGESSLCSISLLSGCMWVYRREALGTV